jgi:two-component system response regulator VicR
MSKETTAHILLVDDEKTLATLLKESFKIEGFTSKYCKDGEEAWELFKTEKFDLCLLDVNMPKMNGLELGKLIREKDAFVPILFLTANSQEDEKIKGFEIGADDYMTKPFSLKELNARIRALLKRSQGQRAILAHSSPDTYQLGSLLIDFSNQIIKNEIEEKKISKTESELFKLFIQHKNQVLTRNTILLHVWGRDDFYTARNLDVYINKLRKLIKMSELAEISNIHGTGFKLIEKQIGS